MKKVITFIGIIGMVLLLGVGSSVTITQAASSSENDAQLMQQSRSIIYSTSYAGNIVPRPTYAYNYGGWSGTLYLNSYQFDGTRTLANYKGTVYCSGTCPIPSNSSTN